MEKKELSFCAFNEQMPAIKRVLTARVGAADSIFFHIEDTYIGVRYKLEGDPEERYIKFQHSDLHHHRKRPIITLCGVTNFNDKLIQLRIEEELTLLENIVLLKVFPETASDYKRGSLCTLHKQKIDMCDAILVINSENYVDATISDIAYARANGKTVYFYKNDYAKIIGIE